jgi:hypothetical protein
MITSVPYLPTTKAFSKEAEALAYDVNRIYVDIAKCVNARTIGIFPTNKPVATGEDWYLSGTKQQTIRQIYPVSGAGSIAHGINTSNISGFTRIYGTFTNGTNFYPLPYVDIVAVTNQIGIVITPSNIVLNVGAGAPTIQSGVIILEWLSNP